MSRAEGPNFQVSLESRFVDPLPFTIRTVRAALRLISESREDDEAAHGMQDRLFRQTLRAIAEGDLSLAESRALASETLKVDDIEFSRWMA